MDCKSIQNSSSSRRAWKYEVFLSFRGEDTRYKFTDHLFAALKRKGVSVFKDDKELKKGKAISSELLAAIEESRICIVVFSRTYADSTWCLEELAKIAECVDVHQRNVLPVFYDVTPSEVREQSGDYEKFFTKHEKRFKENLDKVQRWRQALSKVGGLSNWDVQNKPEAREIEKIVQEVISILGHKFSSLADDLVGIQSRAEKLENLLNIGSNNDVQVVGICGMSGIGKTTLAAVVHDRISHHFDACSFLVDVSRFCKDHDLVHLQKQLLCETLHGGNLKIWDSFRGTNLISTRLSLRKVLIVLDNIDEPEQLEKLVGKRNWFGMGSRIIITTRNEHILKEYGVDEIYKVEQLNEAEVTQLLCRKAFKCDDPKEDYKEQIHRVVEYVSGHPLATKVLGSSLSGQDVSKWEYKLSRLQSNTKEKIMNVLQISFEGLDNLEKKIFLDIACFFNGIFRDRVMRILDCCGFHPKIGISVLIDKSLLFILEEKVYIHDLLQKLGRNLVQEGALNEPRNWSRLWHYKDFYQVMMENKETEHVTAIVLDLKDEQDSSLRAEALSNVCHLRLLIFHNVKFSGSLRCLSNKLNYLEWHDYPFNYLPSNFQPYRLVELIMPNSSFTQLWGNTKLLQPLSNLKSLDFRHSKKLIKVTNLDLFPNLDRLNLDGCIRLWQVDESIGALSNLRYLNLNGCKNLVSLPLCVSSLSLLETLCLSGCSKLKNQLEEKGREEELNEGETTWQSIFSIVHRSFWSPLYFFSTRHKGTVGLSLASLPSLPSLRDLDLSYCHLSEIPDSLGSLCHLESLDLSGNIFKTVPTISKLSKLAYLSFSHCKKLESLPDLPSSMDSSSVSLEEPRYIWRAESQIHSGLYMLDCPNLTEIERCSSWALQWLIKCVDQEPSRFGFRYDDFIVPGSEIPRWFSHQSLGPSMDIPMHPSARGGDRNFLGVTFSAVFVTRDIDFGKFDDGSKKSWIRCTMHSNSYTEHGIDLENEQLTVGLDHLWLHFVCPEQPYFPADILDVTFTAGPGLEIKKCGIHWLFKQDVCKLGLVSRMLNQCRSSMQLQIDEALEMANKMISDSSKAENSKDSVQSNAPSSS